MIPSIPNLVAAWVVLSSCFFGSVFAQQGLVPAFPVQKDEICLERRAQPHSPFDRTGRRFAILGLESGSFEAWAYPLKLLRNFEFSFLLGGSTRPIRGSDIDRWIEVTPAATIVTYTYQSFTVRAIFITPVQEAGAMVLLDVDAIEPLTVVCSFWPVLQPMWPAGLGGQYAYWDDQLKAYLISESSRRNHGLVGSPAARGISYAPAHMLSDVPNEFRIDLTDPRALSGKYVPIYLAGGKGDREKVIESYRRLSAQPQKYYEETVEHYRRFRSQTMSIRTPLPELDLAFEWAKLSLEGLFVDNPDLGLGLTAGLGMSGTSGRPGFGWFFGGDTFINSLALNSCGASPDSRQAISFMRQFQREDGKMAHEVSQSAGYINWFKDYGYGYIHGDTSPFFVVAVQDYFRQTGDLDFVREVYPSLKKAFGWAGTTDANGDGLMDNRLAGLGGLEYGALTDIASDIYLSAVWVESCRAMSALASAQEDHALAERAEGMYQHGKQALAQRFWSEKQGAYVYAFDEQARQVEEISPMSAVALMWKLVDPERAAGTLRRIQAADVTTDWGIRGLSRASRFYEPLNYNYGAVWPFTSGWVAAAQFAHGFRQQGLTTLVALARHHFDNQLGAATELYSGSQNVWPQEAVSHQGFSSTGFIFPLVRGLLGLHADAPAKRLMFAPSFPANWSKVHIENYRIGPGSVCLDYERGTDAVKAVAVSQGLDRYSLEFAPVLEPGSKVKQAVPPSHVVTLTDEPVTIRLSIEPGVDLLPPMTPSRTGDPSRGIRIITVDTVSEKQLRVEVQGLSGTDYSLGLTNGAKVSAVRGGKLEGDKLLLRMPDGPAREFVKATIELELR
jgi:glycogen debranching enzyme